jgi:hypothetical protein
MMRYRIHKSIFSVAQILVARSYANLIRRLKDTALIGLESPT